MSEADPRRSELLLKVVEECLDRHEHEGFAGVEAVLAEHPDLADVARSRLRRLHVLGLIEKKSTADSVIPERLGQFRILERLGTGGMGVVYLAEQEPLGRRVALKLIRSRSRVAAKTNRPHSWSRGAAFPLCPGRTPVCGWS